MGENILDQMRMGIKARFPVRLRNFEAYLRPLTIAETIAITCETQEDLQSKPIGARNAITEHVIFSIKTLQAASMTTPDSKDPKLTTYMLQNLTPDELHFLMKEYCIGADRINPSFEKLSQERIEKLVQDAKKNSSVLIELSFLELVNVCQHLLTSSPTDK